MTDPDGDHLQQVVTDLGSAFDAPQVVAARARSTTPSATLPPEHPRARRRTRRRTADVCASFTGPDTARLLLPGKSGAAAISSPEIVESALSQRGQADEVTVEPGHVALAQTAGGTATFLITPSGSKFPFTDATLATALGYGSVRATSVAPAVLHLLPTGPALDPAAARRTSS